ncbi:MAG TPA: glycine dehydrogenase, partial [Thermomicrobiales bacterium]|nr:glycine dehydrogenase [Thermomicrobiales bacterium]
TVYMATLGPEGFREVGRRSFQNAHYLAGRIGEVPGFTLALSEPFFHEFVVRTPVPAAELNRQMLQAGIVGGFDLGAVDDRLDHHLLVCATEVHDREALERYVEVISDL